MIKEQPYVWEPAHQVLAPNSGLQVVLAGILEASRHYTERVSRHPLSLAERFHTLAEQWRAETAALSSITEIAIHPGYQEIIGLGPAVLPLLLRELERETDQGLWALKAITGVDPVPPEQRGRLREMAASWLKWGKEQGLSW